MIVLIGGKNIETLKSYEFIGMLMTMLKKHCKFIWFLSMMIENPMNSYGFRFQHCFLLPAGLKKFGKIVVRTVGGPASLT